LGASGDVGGDVSHLKPAQNICIPMARLAPAWVPIFGVKIAPHRACSGHPNGVKALFQRPLRVAIVLPTVVYCLMMGGRRADAKPHARS